MILARHALGLGVLALTIAACGDDAPVGAGGSDASSATTAETTGETTGVAEASSSAVASSVASSASTGEPEVCPWPGQDPGGLAATGALVGDVVENVAGLIDQCNVARNLWDFAGGYRILSMTPGW